MKITSKINQIVFRRSIVFMSLSLAVVAIVVGFVAQGANAATYSMWGGNITPATTRASDTAAVELGVKFKSSVAGKVTGIKFYKGVGNRGTHTGSLWASNGTKLASVIFTNETSSGWQTASFAQPVSITANTVYVASYHAPNGGYSIDENYFTRDRTSGPLTMLASTSNSRNGVYRYSNNVVYPNQTYRDSNYWVDVVFSDNTTPVNANIATFTATPQSVISGSASTLAWNVTAGQSCSINNGIGSVANEGTRVVSPTQTTTYIMTCQGVDGGNQATKSTIVTVGHHAKITSFSAAPATIQTGQQSVLKWAVENGENCSINNGVGKVALTGEKSVSPTDSTTYTLTCQGINGGSQATSQATVAVTAAPDPEPITTSSLWPDGDIPSVQTSDDTMAVELGVRFSSNKNAKVQAIKFYKGAGNTGTHVGNLWTANGTNLARVTFTNESATGWQVAELSTPVEITAGTTYVVSYHAPNGRYAINTNYFTSERTSGILTAPQSVSSAGNGVFKYGNSGFPNGSWNASNYWVDVVVDSTIGGDTPTVPEPPTAGPPAPAPGKQWNLSFNEEFNGTDYDRNKLTPCFDWNYGGCTNSFNNGREHYDPGQVRVSNGSAKLVAEPRSPLNQAGCQGGVCTYNSGLLSTARPRADNGSDYLYAFTYGYVEANLKLPATRGFFTAFWMMPSSPSYNYDTEIDILENLGDDNSTMFMTYHYNGRSQSHAVNRGVGNNGTCPATDLSGGFHRFGVDWQPTYIAWYIDGVKCGQFNGDATTIENGPMQIILNLMVDVDWQRNWNVGLTDPTLTRQLEVDYIRVYQQQ